MTIDTPFIAHSELTDEIYVIDKKAKYCVTEQVMKAVVATNRAITKADYEARLKADIVSVLEEISLEIEELEKEVDSAKFAAGWICGTHDSLTVIKNRIDILKAVLKAKEKKDAT